MRNGLLNALKGFFVGSSMLVPGVSGGTMAIILGIYDRIISAMGHLTQDLKKNLWLLGTFGIGGLLGIILLARPLSYLTKTYPLPVLYLFMGAICGGVPCIFRKAGVRAFSLRVIAYPLIGVAIVLLLDRLPHFNLLSDGGISLTTVLLFAAAGIIMAVALVLPGVSGSQMLLMLGLYEKTMDAIAAFDLAYILPMGAGILLGLILTTKLLETLLRRYPRASYLIILGFIIGSVVYVFPEVPFGWYLLICPLTFLAGFAGVYFLSRFERD